MSGFAVDVSAVRCSAERTATIRADFDAELARLRCDVEDVVLSRWRGEAAASFAAMWQQWERSARVVSSELARLGDELARTGVEYRVRDGAAAAGLRAAS